MKINKWKAARIVSEVSGNFKLVRRIAMSIFIIHTPCGTQR